MRQDPFALSRFLDAQDPVFDDVRRELRSGRKEGHWMWFVFPQLKGLGRSPTATYYGIGSAAEAKAYVNHPVLGARLVEATELVLAQAGNDLRRILGYPDDLKFRSSMTLFEAVSGRACFTSALETFCPSGGDMETLHRLQNSQDGS